MSQQKTRTRTFDYRARPERDFHLHFTNTSWIDWGMIMGADAARVLRVTPSKGVIGHCYLEVWRDKDWQWLDGFIISPGSTLHLVLPVGSHCLEVWENQKDIHDVWRENKARWVRVFG